MGFIFSSTWKKLITQITKEDYPPVKNICGRDLAHCFADGRAQIKDYHKKLQFDTNLSAPMFIGARPRPPNLMAGGHI